MTRFLEKRSELHLLEELFDLLHENMSTVAPSGLSYEMEKRQWLSCVGPAMEKEPRQIVLLYAGAELAGFCMYYVNGGVFVVEEVQIRKAYRQSVLFHSLCRFLMQVIPRDTAVIEAYADKRNVVSQRLIRKFGMEQIGENGDGSCIHYRGSLAPFLQSKKIKVPE